MTDLSTSFLVAAAIRKARSDGYYAYLRHRGFADRGAILFVRQSRDGITILTQTRDQDGNMAWLKVTEPGVSPQAAEEFITRAHGRDADLWIVEIECASDYNPFGGAEIR